VVVQFAGSAEDIRRFYGLVAEGEKGSPEGRRISSRELFGHEKIVMIEHEGAVYRLLRTRQGKLILNK
jgi:hemin uptake protein HemP